MLADAKEFQQQVEQSLSRIQLHQNNAVAVEKHELPVWTMDIPIKDGKQIDMLNISIFKDGAANDEEQQGLWNIQLNFDFETLGQVHAKLSLYGQEIMASLWAEKTETQSLIQSHLGELETQLAKTGLEVGCVQCLTGKVPENKIILNDQSLVDVHL